MIRRSPKTGSAVDQQHEELARRENELRDQMQKLQQMIEEAPRLAQETSRRQREELLERAHQRGSRLDASLSLRDKRWGDEESGRRRPGSLRKERREGRIIFLVLVIALFRFFGSSIRSILSSAFTRLCTCAALAACAAKRSMKRCSLASIACCRA